MQRLCVPSPAKINLRLHILGRREDGYHSIDTLFHKISLCDELIFDHRPGNALNLTCSDDSLPLDSRNLVYSAAKLLLRDQSVSADIHIKLNKRIPVGAGLGGGSSNAATTLYALNKLLSLNLSESHLKHLAVSLGADVPFFISGSTTAHGTGIGEKLRPVSLARPLWFVIVYPDLTVSTSWAYGQYAEHNNLLTKQHKKVIVNDSIYTIKQVISLLYNDFEQTVFARYPVLGTIKRKLLENGAEGALLSGSGSSLFGIFSRADDALRTQKKLLSEMDDGYSIFAVRSWEEDPHMGPPKDV